MNHFLIDFENVSSDELKQVKGIKKNDDVVLFYSNACSTYDGCHECFPSVKPYFIHGNHGRRRSEGKNYFISCMLFFDYIA